MNRAVDAPPLVPVVAVDTGAASYSNALQLKTTDWQIMVLFRRLQSQDLEAHIFWRRPGASEQCAHLRLTGEEFGAAFTWENDSIDGPFVKRDGPVLTLCDESESALRCQMTLSRAVCSRVKPSR